MLKITSRVKIWFSFSAVLLIISVIFLSVWGLRLGIDFQGGSLAELEFADPVNAADIKELLQSRGLGDPVVQAISEHRLIIKTKTLTQAETTDYKNSLSEAFGQFQEIRFESIGPTISRELVRKAYIQVILVVLGILLYLAYAFRKLNSEELKNSISPWYMGVAAILALIHDLVITVGLFSLLGHFRGVEIDNLFITALLTIAGFSVHDTIVVFDRVRENLERFRYKSLNTIIDFSVDSTLARSINTSSTLIFVLVALLLFGGATIFNFVLALLAGVIVGTYSSIFIASPLLGLLAKKRFKG